MGMRRTAQSMTILLGRRCRRAATRAGRGRRERRGSADSLLVLADASDVESDARVDKEAAVVACGDWVVLRCDARLAAHRLVRVLESEGHGEGAVLQLM